MGGEEPHVRGYNANESHVLQILADHPVECSLCDPRCMFIEHQGREGATASLAERGLAIFWDCRFSAYKHGRLIALGQLAVRLMKIPLDRVCNSG